MTDDDRPRYGERIAGTQAPGYGEYAPPGWVNPVVPADDDPEADGEAQDPARGPLRTEAPGSRATPPFDAPPPTGEPVPGRPPTTLRNASFNRFATLVLLAYGLYDVVRGALQTSQFVSMYVGEFKGLGYLKGTFESEAALHRVAVVSAVGSVAVFLLVAIWAIRRLRAGRVSWVILLLSGVAANLITGIFVVVIVMHDPSFVGVAAAPL